MQALVVNLGKYVFAKLTQVTNTGNFTFDVQSAQNIANNNIEVYAIEAYSAAEVATDQLGNTLIPSADAPKIIVTLSDSQGNLLLENFSFQRMRASQNSGFPVYLNDFRIDITKCYVSLNVTGGTLAQNQVCGFNLYYSFKK